MMSSSAWRARPPSSSSWPRRLWSAAAAPAAAVVIASVAMATTATAAAAAAAATAAAATFATDGKTPPPPPPPPPADSHSGATPFTGTWARPLPTPPPPSPHTFECRTRHAQASRSACTPPRHGSAAAQTVPPGEVTHQGRAVYIGDFGAAALANPHVALSDHLWALAAYLAACEGWAGERGGGSAAASSDGLSGRAMSSSSRTGGLGTHQPLWLVFGGLPKAAASMDVEAPFGSPSAAASWATAAALTLAAYVVPRERVFFAEDLEGGPRCFDGGVYALNSVPQAEREGSGGDHSAFRGMSYHAWHPDAELPKGEAVSSAGSPDSAPFPRVAAPNGTESDDDGEHAEAGARIARGVYVPMSPVAQRAGLDLIRAALHARFHLHPADRAANRPHLRRLQDAHPRHGSRWARRAMAAAAAAARADAVASPAPVSVLLDARPDAATLRWEATGPLLSRLRGMREITVHARTDGMSSLSFGDQVRTFAGADVVVAPQGAGLANLLAAAPGARVIVVWPCCWEGGDLDDPATTAGSWTAAVAPLLRVHLSYIKCAELEGPSGFRLAAMTVEERQTPGWVCRWGHPRFSPRRFVTPVVPTLEALSTAIDAVRSGEIEGDVGTPPGASAAKANPVDGKEQTSGGLSPGPAFARLVATYEAAWAPHTADSERSARRGGAGGFLGGLLWWLFGERAALVCVAVATLVGVAALFALVLASAAASTRRRPRPPEWEAHGRGGDEVLGGGRRGGGTRRRLRA